MFLDHLKKTKNINKPEADKFLFRRPIFRVREKIGAQNLNARPIEKQTEKLLFALYYLNNAYSFHF